MIASSSAEILMKDQRMFSMVRRTGKKEGARCYQCQGKHDAQKIPL